MSKLDKVVAFIPTRERATALSVAHDVSPHVRHIFILGRDVKFDIKGLPDNCTFLNQPEEWGISGTRNACAELALENNYDYSIQIDDDIKIQRETIPEILRTFQRFPGVGVVSNNSRIQNYWNSKVIANGPFAIGGASQIIATKYECMTEMFNSYQGYPFSTLNGLEDAIFSSRVWSAGWGILRVTSPESQHGILIPHLEKHADMGGLPPDERSKDVVKSVRLMEEFCKPGGILLEASYEFSIKYKEFKCKFRYNYEQMCKNVTDRWGTQGYEDSKGRKF